MKTFYVVLCMRCNTYRIAIWKKFICQRCWKSTPNLTKSGMRFWECQSMDEAIKKCQNLSARDAKRKLK